MFKKYIKFLTKATNQHGVHSPFVYKLVTVCIYKKSPNIVVDEYKKHRNHLKIANLFDKTNVSKKYGLLLNRLINHLNICSALEFGTSVGLRTTLMCIHNLNVKVDTVESCKEMLDVAENYFKRFNFQHQITTYNGNFDDLLPVLLSKKNYDLIFFDGNHQKKDVLKHFEACLKAKHNNSVFIFEDIYESDEKKQVWETIKNHSEVKVTVDLFKLGLVFFRREQEKEHFKIRF